MVANGEKRLPSAQVVESSGAAGDTDAAHTPVAVALASREEPPEAPADTAPPVSPYADREPAWLARLALTVSVLATLAVVVVTQAQLSGYAAGGGGAAEVAAPSLVVAISLIGSLVVALLLSIRELRAVTLRLRAHGLRATGHTLLATINPLPDLRSTWRAGISRLAAGRGALQKRLAARQIPVIRAYPPPSAQARLQRKDARSIGLLAALLLSLLADVGAAHLSLRPFAQWLWLGSVALLIAVAWMWSSSAPQTPSSRQQIRRRQPNAPTGSAASNLQPAQASFVAASPLRAAFRAIRRMLTLDLTLLAILTIGALALRLPNLTTLPYVVHGDEAQCGLEALRWLHGEVPSLLSVGWLGLPEAGYGLPALVMLVAGPTLFGLRLSSVILGTLSILLLYALAREFTSRRVAFLAAALLCVAHVHIQFSRMGIHNIHAVFAVTLTLWLFARALRTTSPLWATLTGASLSFSLQVYWGARIVFLIVLVVIVGLWLLRRSALSGRAQALGWMLLSFVVAVGPLTVYFTSDQDALESRTQQVLVTTSDLWTHQHVVNLFGTTNMQAILLRQFATIPLIPGSLADQSLQYGPRFPLFDALLATLTLVGFWYAMLHLRQPLYLLLAVWVAGVALGGGALTIDMPWWPRLIVLVPALCLLAALMVNEIARLLLRAINGLTLETGLWARSRRRQFWRELYVQSVPMLGGRAALFSWLLALALLGYSGLWSGYHYF
ncbi:MAG: glycosyltransferase family 39 protein, partial [Ktedonobacterales bacterium]